MECRFICTPRSSNVPARLAALAMRRAVSRTCASGTPSRGMKGNVEHRQMRQYVFEPVCVLREPGSFVETLLNDHADHRREQERITARAYLEVDVSEFRRLGAARIDHDQAAVRISRDFTQGCAGARNAMREPRVFADEQPRLCSVRSRRASSRRPSCCNPELAGLLLRERTRTMHGSKECTRRAAVDVGQVVTLAPAAVVEDRFPAVLVADRGKACSYFADGRVPIDLFEAAVVAPAQRLRQTMWAVLVVVEPRRFLAHVASGNRVRVVAVYFDELASVLAPTGLQCRSCTHTGCRRSTSTRTCSLLVRSNGFKGGVSYSIQLLRESHHGSWKGLTSARKDHASRGWCARWNTSAAIAAG